ncbi:hypothetical protein TrRE_jg2662 [Triparma retinervis]|uniref:PCI domain-containing protein n=1 Tax=Triparma retinervis TaxID=2557542 RepID=A0A9W7DTI6_9STRA|nr:hypothetical protein TrRE_jg2662 [Triparma retinervis]
MACLVSVSNDVENALISSLVASITSSTSGSPESKLRMIVNLYNLRPPTSSYSLLMSAISYASSTNQMPLLSPSLSNLPTLISTLPITESETRALYLQVSKAFDASGDKPSGRSAMVKYLLTFTPSSPMTPSDRSSVKAAIREAVTQPMMLWGQGTSFGDLPCVASVASDPDFQGIGSLLDVFEVGKFCDWQAWKKEHGSKDLGLDIEACEEAMRLLSICSLASEKGEIPFGDIARTLEVEEGGVERWVVKAIAGGLMKGKIDQVKKSVVVERSVVRKFGKEEWGRLRDTIGEWRNRVKTTAEELKGRQKK